METTYLLSMFKLKYWYPALVIFAGALVGADAKTLRNFLADNHQRTGGRHHWCATSLVHAYRQQNQPAGQLGKPAAAANYFSFDHATLTRSYTSPGSHFSIFYTEAGVHAVNLADLNSNGAPDYIEEISKACDSSYILQINRYGFRSPLVPSKDTVKIFVGNLAPGYYALTDFGTNEIEIRNNFTGFIPPAAPNDYERFPELAIRVTIAHEFFHLVQFTYAIQPKLYNDPHLNSAYPFIYEASAVWMEDEVYNSINDYLQYLDVFYTSINHSLLTADGGTEYGRCLWFKYLEEKPGPGYRMVRAIWERLETDTSLPNAMDQVLRDSAGSSLTAAYRDFSVWCYFAGNRADSTRYFQDGARFFQKSGDTIVPSVDKNFSQQNTYNLGLADLSFQYVRITQWPAAGTVLRWSFREGKGLVSYLDGFTVTQPGSLVSIPGQRGDYLPYLAVSNGSVERDSFHLFKFAGADTLFVSSGSAVPFNSADNKVQFMVAVPPSTPVVVETLFVTQDSFIYSNKYGLLQVTVPLGRFYSFEIAGRAQMAITGLEITLNSAEQALLGAGHLKIYRLQEPNYAETLAYVATATGLRIIDTLPPVFTVGLFQEYTAIYQRPPFPQPLRLSQTQNPQLKIPGFDVNSRIINIYSISGTLVKVLARGQNDAFFIWDVNRNQVAPGIYIFRIMKVGGSGSLEAQKSGKLAILQ
jgi:hypothetical protein